TLNITAAAKGKGVTVITKKQTPLSKTTTASLSVTFPTGVRGVAKKVKNITKFYRNDLQKAALARASRIISAQGPKKTVNARRPRGKKAVSA
ncbi:hypothetical protein BDK51DRAFT_42069, partial [Blyttiomyces helicus]